MPENPVIGMTFRSGLGLRRRGSQRVRRHCGLKLFGLLKEPLILDAVVGLIFEGWIIEASENVQVGGMSREIVKTQAPRAVVFARPWTFAGLRQTDFNLVGDGAGDQIIALEIQMHVLEKNFAPGERVRAALIRHRFSIRQSHALLLIPGGHTADDAIDLAIGPKAQGVQIAGQIKFLRGIAVPARAQ